MFKSILKSSLLGASLAITAFAVTPSIATAEVPLEVYAELARTASVRISPDGKHVAMLSPHKGSKKIFVYDLTDPNAKTIVIPTPENSIIKNIGWASDKHVVMFARFPKKNMQRGLRKYMTLYSRWVSSNIETGKSVVMAEDRITRRGLSIGGGNIIHDMPQDPKNVLMLWREYAGKPITRHLRVNLDTGKSGVYRSMPIETGTTILSLDGTKVLARSQSPNDTTLEIAVPDKNGNFQPIWSKTFDEDIGPEAGLFTITDDGSKVVLFDTSSEQLTLKTVDMKTGAEGVFNLDLSGMPSGATYGPEVDSITGEIVGVSYLDDFNEQIYFKEPYKTWHRKAKKAFPGKFVRILSRSSNNKSVTLHVQGPRDPGEFYLFEPKEGRISSLGKSYPEIAAKDVSVSKRYSYAARDGKQIPAYLMLPPGKTKADGPFPLIAMPHGGPEARDNAGFDFWSQFLTSRGYAVFKPQFRGSNGFGRAYVQSGRGEFGGKMVDDTIDGVRHLIQTGVATADKVCANGASYGGYQAMALPVRAPDMFKCSLSVAGVSDLQRMFQFEVDTKGKNSGAVKYWNQVMGNRHKEAEKLKMQSPAFHVDKIKAEMLLVHGENDVTVPITQSEHMSDALKKAGRSDYKVMMLKGDDHNLSVAQSRRELLEASEVFFAKHLK